VNDGPFDYDDIASEAASRAQTPPDPKRPLFRELPPPLPYPIEHLGALRPAAEALQAITQAPGGLCAQSLLAAATLILAARFDVELPSGRRPLTGSFGSIGESGERKSSVDRLALLPIRNFEEKLAREYVSKHEAFLQEKYAYDAARDQARKDTKGNKADLIRKLEAIGPTPKAPAGPMFVVDDTTPEALILHLEQVRPYGGLFTDEGGILVGGPALNDETKMRMGALLNRLWDGSPIRRLRVSTGSSFLPGRRCSVHIMMQRKVAEQLLSDEMLCGIGTLARMLVIEPESTIGTRLYREPTQVCLREVERYVAHMAEILKREPQMVLGQPDVLDPVPLQLSRDARAIWIAFHDACERDLAPGKALSTVKAFGAKLAEHAGRLAAVLAAYRDPETVEVAAGDMAAATELAKHYANELMRLQGIASIQPDLRLAERLLAWWTARPNPRAHLAEVYQTGPHSIRDAKTAKRVISILEESGWITRLPARTMLDGSPRRDAWALVP
jgi:hypothetical protein